MSIGVKGRVNGNARFYIDPAMQRKYIRDTMNDTKAFFQAAMNRPGRSSPGEYPANDSGALSASTSVVVSGATGTISVNTTYAGYLRDGTSRMAPRKMLFEALREVAARNRHIGTLRGAVRFGNVG